MKVIIDWYRNFDISFAHTSMYKKKRMSSLAFFSFPLIFISHGMVRMQGVYRLFTSVCSYPWDSIQRWKILQLNNFTLNKVDTYKSSSSSGRCRHMLMDMERLDPPWHTHLESKYRSSITVWLYFLIIWWNR
jgi:hypothetical protein